MNDVIQNWQNALYRDFDPYHATGPAADTSDIFFNFQTGAELPNEPDYDDFCRPDSLGCAVPLDWTLDSTREIWYMRKMRVTSRTDLVGLYPSQIDYPLNTFESNVAHETGHALGRADDGLCNAGEVIHTLMAGTKVENDTLLPCAETSLPTSMDIDLGDFYWGAWGIGGGSIDPGLTPGSCCYLEYRASTAGDTLYLEASDDGWADFYHRYKFFYNDGGTWIEWRAPLLRDTTGYAARMYYANGNTAYANEIDLSPSAEGHTQSVCSEGIYNDNTTGEQDIPGEWRCSTVSP